MSIAIIQSLSNRIVEAEAAMSPLNERAFSVELEALIPDANALTDEERRGCAAEIVGHRFATTTQADRGPWDSYFGPVSSGVDASGVEHHMPDATLIDREIVEYWKARSEQTPNPVLRARYADLAWEIGRIWNIGHPSESQIALPRELAQRAAEAYLESSKLLDVGSSLEMFRAWQFLDRAVSLSTFIKDKAMTARVKTAVFDFNRTNRAAGRTDQWWLIDDWAWGHKGLDLTDAERLELAGWLEDVLGTYSDIGDTQRFDPHQALQAADRIARWGRKAGKPDLGIAALKKAGSAFETFAKQANAMTAIAWFEDLSVRYRQENLAEEASRVDAAISARAEEAKQSMKTASASISVSVEEMEKWLDSLTEGSSKLALGRIAMHLVSKVDFLRGVVESNAANAPLHAGISITIMDDNGFTTATIGSVKDDMPGRILSAAATVIGASSPWLHQALARAKSSWNIDAEALMAFLSQSLLFPPRVHSLLKSGLDAWYAGDFIKAIHVLVPQVEAALREMLKNYGESPMRHNAREGGFETLGMGTVLMTNAFKAEASADFRLHLRALYTSPKGFNLRNKLAHGLAGPDAFGLGMANWVVHSLLAIRIFGHLDD